jgi:hypothetical protein
VVSSSVVTVVLRIVAAVLVSPTIREPSGILP